MGRFGTRPFAHYRKGGDAILFRVLLLLSYFLLFWNTSTVSVFLAVLARGFGSVPVVVLVVQGNKRGLTDDRVFDGNLRFIPRSSSSNR